MNGNEITGKTIINLNNNSLNNIIESLRTNIKRIYEINR